MPAPPAADAPRESCRTAHLTRAPRQATELFRSLDEAAFGDEADAMHTDAAERLVPPRPGASPRFTGYLKIVGKCRTGAALACRRDRGGSWMPSRSFCETRRTGGAAACA